MPRIRAFLLKDEDFGNRCYGVLTYNLHTKQFRFQLQPGYTYWEYPPTIDTAFRLGMTELSPELMKMFIQERIIPPSRVNIANILQAAGLKEYDEFGMLMYCKGRCCQDWMYLEEISMQEYKRYTNKWKMRLLI